MIDIREDILQKRYYWKDENGKCIEDWSGLCKRVASNIAMNEEEEKDFYEILHSYKFLPNTPTLINAGRTNFSFSGCFFLPVEDSIDSIYDGIKHAALIHKAGGGTGFNFSKLRPNGEKVGTTRGVASGPCSFMSVYDASTSAIKQGGVRRGANMGMLNCNHPDIFEFINSKKVDGIFSNFNISVGITNDFIKAVINDSEWNLTFKDIIYQTIKARDLWNNIIDNAWENGEPGLIFLDEINKYNPLLNFLGEIEGVNPCGEQPLYPYEACVLGSINLSSFVTSNNWNYKGLSDVIFKAVRFLDNIIDKQAYPLQKIEKMHKSNRKIGLGVMGWADSLLKLGIKYDSDKALELAESIMKFVQTKALEASAKLGEEKGSFPNIEKSSLEQPMRNATVTTIAPTGSLSIIAQTSSGIEPIYDFITKQKRAVGDHEVIHPLYKKYKEENPNKSLPDYFVTSKDISPEFHIKMQAIFQKYTSNAVSKTINLPISATKEDVEKAFMLAYATECKGITVYRDGSRKNQVLSSIKDLKDSTNNDVLDAKRIQIKTPEGNIYVNIAFYNDKPLEMFITTPDENHKKCPKCETIVFTGGGENYDSLARIVSLALRYDVPITKIISQLEKANRKYGNLNSVPNAIIRAFGKININDNKAIQCPDCGNELIFEENCRKCQTCGYSKCS
jgi:ribonucleoside-diphosphate reductase alpha chain